MNKNDKTSFIYSKECSLLAMDSTPYIGVYSDNYSFVNQRKSFFIDQSTFYKKQIRQTLPEKLIYAIEDLDNRNIPVEYMLSNYDGTFFYDKFIKSHSNQMLRVNIVCHPYIFFDLTNLKKDHFTFAYICVYKSNPNDSINDSMEESGLRIDCEKVLLNMNKKEVILHKSDDLCPALSPNNCALLINLNSLFLNFYLVCVVLYNDKPVKALVHNINIIFNTNIPLFKIIDDSFQNLDTNVISGNTFNLMALPFLYELYTSTEIFTETVNFTFGFFINLMLNVEFNILDLKSIIKSMFSCLFFNIKSIEYITDIGNYFYLDLCHMISESLRNPKIHNFSELFMFGSNTLNDKQCLIQILRKYFNHLTKKIKSLYTNHLSLIKCNFKEKVEILEKKDKDKKLFYEMIQKNVIQIFSKNNIKVDYDISDFSVFQKMSLTAEDSIKNCENHQINILKDALQDVFNVKHIIKKDKMDEFNIKILKLNEISQNFIFYSCWQYRGQLLGIHNEFGKHSFLRNNVISSIYHCGQQDIVEMMLQFIQIFEDFYKF